MSKHLDMRAMDPPGKEDRRWECLGCGKVVKDLQELMDDRSCTGPKLSAKQRLLRALGENEKE